MCAALIIAAHFNFNGQNKVEKKSRHALNYLCLSKNVINDQIESVCIVTPLINVKIKHKNKNKYQLQPYRIIANRAN